MTSNKMDEELRNAAVRGDVEYLQKCVESNKPIHYYLSYFPKEEDHSEKFHFGNIFHMAAFENKEEFIREAIWILPQEAKQQLLLQPMGSNKWNSLHVAAYVGNVEIVKMFLDVYRCLPTFPPHISERPWLQKTQEGDSPCFVAVYGYQEECALEIYKMDTQLISNMTSSRGSSLVFEAIINKMSKLALEILSSLHPISYAGDDVTIGNTPFHIIYDIEGLEESEEIFRQLLQRQPKLIKQKTKDGFSAFQVWARTGKIWPFKVLLECNVIIQDVNKVFTYLVSSTDRYGNNTLHTLAKYSIFKEDAKKIAELLLNEIYKKESPSNSNNQHPWLVNNKFGDSPLSLAIEDKKESLALYLLSVDDNVVIESKRKNVLFLAVENGCCIAAEEILKIIDNKGWNQLLFNDRNLNVLHLAPFCTENFLERLMEGHPELIKGIDKEGSTIVHSWIKSDKELLFNFMLESKWNFAFVKLIDVKDYNYQNNPFHVAATTTHEETNQIVRLLVQAYKKYKTNWYASNVGVLPWFVKNKENEGALHLALRNKREDLALYILSLLRDNQSVEELLNYYKPEHSILFLAVQNNHREVTKDILKQLDKGSRAKYLKNTSDGRNILHLATTLADKGFGKWLLGKASRFITEPDISGKTPLHEACSVGAPWFIQAVREKYPSTFNSEPLAWIKSCEKGHVSTIRAFIDYNPGKFRDLCIKHKESPLHHIKLQSLTEYEEFLMMIPRMNKDLINLQNSKGATPLHTAIETRNILLTETLLSMEHIRYNIKDNNKKTAIDLLAQVCKDVSEWDFMCQRIGFDPYIKTSYFQRKTNLLEVRNSLFVVAALLATITFTAGFTLPGGLNQDTGEAILAKKAAFLAFMLSNTLAMCASMLVLICLVLSMVHSSSKSLLLIDRSMIILMVAFYSTLLAFMTGVYLVISSKVFWLAIVVIIMCSLIGISAYRTLLFKLLIITSRKKRDQMQHIEQGLPIDEQNPLLRSNSSDFDKEK